MNVLPLTVYMGFMMSARGGLMYGFGRNIARPKRYAGSRGLLCDLLWVIPDKDFEGWGENDRGVSYTFGPDKVAEFHSKHDLDLICRAHQILKPFDKKGKIGFGNISKPGTPPHRGWKGMIHEPQYIPLDTFTIHDDKGQSLNLLSLLTPRTTVLPKWKAESRKRPLLL
ncbi:hypothetical protein IFM89_016756 [Coptis chinensis]|uniref:Calcineurin-like phosphoesterase domain-containing protein n=1 Tax=Coptis chinensis TaxID=261450 RepID=A0A835H4C0_9MAGN|nr:hypothetical protein IFM89_016756 [Coptis chinensis]